MTTFKYRFTCGECGDTCVTSTPIPETSGDEVVVCAECNAKIAREMREMLTNLGPVTVH